MHYYKDNCSDNKNNLEEEKNMLKKFMDYVIQHEGLVLSEATLNTADRLTSSYTFLMEHELKPELCQEIRNCFDEEPTNFNFTYGRCHLLSNKSELAEYLLNEDVFNFFNDIAPDGYYFGSQEGDGACFGWWQYEEENINELWGQTEPCPHCEFENFYPYWDVKEKGFVATCQNCGKTIMLCDACHHEENGGECNWKNDTNPEGICYRKMKGE